MTEKNRMSDFDRVKLSEIISDEITIRHFAQLLRDMTALVNKRNQKWWHNPHTGERIERNFGEIIALCHSELSEALEGHRKKLQDDKLPEYPMVTVEFADTLIRILDVCGGFNFDLAGAFIEKMAYNNTRADHTHEARVAAGGKTY